MAASSCCRPRSGHTSRTTRPSGNENHWRPLPGKAMSQLTNTLDSGSRWIPFTTGQFLRIFGRRVRLRGRFGDELDWQACVVDWAYRIQGELVVVVVAAERRRDLRYRAGSANE